MPGSMTARSKCTIPDGPAPPKAAANPCETATEQARSAIATSRDFHSMTARTAFEQAAKSVAEVLMPSAGASTDILDTLEEEHDEVQELLQQLTKSESAAEQRGLLNKVKLALVPHTKAEEIVVYDRVAALKGEKAKIDGAEGYTEHALASATLIQLTKLSPDTPEFKADAKVLKELVDHHIKEEERNIWSQVRENFSPEQRAQMNRDFLAAKKRVPIP
jgi:hemerythrin superfamily protein